MCSARTCQTDVNNLHISMRKFCLEIVSVHEWNAFGRVTI